jgi:hypothetical protein
MVHPKLRLQRTALDNLISNLRGEVGEIVTSWILCKRLRAQSNSLQTVDISADMENQDLNVLGILISRLHDDMVARLSELSEPKIGQLTFYFASKKLGQFDSEVSRFRSFILEHGFHEKRNQDISHKVLPEQSDEHEHRFVKYGKVTYATAMALRLMKKIDRAALGPSAVYAWRKGREKRYRMINPPKVGYLMIPHIRLTEAERLQIVIAEEREGRTVWSELETRINGRPAKIFASKQWGVLHLGDRLVALQQYPLQQLTSIDFDPRHPDAANQSE